MVIYIFIAIFILSGVVSQEAQSSIIYKASLFILCIFSGFRATWLGGYDAMYYKKFFDTIPVLSDFNSYHGDFSIGYAFLNSLIRTFTGHYEIYELIYSIISIALLSVVIKLLDFENSQQKCLCLFSYYCYRFIWNNWVTYRQNLSNLLFWIFLILFYKSLNRDVDKQALNMKAVLYATCCLLIPPLFHSSAWANIIILPIMFFIGKMNIKIKIIVIPIVSILLNLFGNGLFNNFLEFMIKYVDERYLVYTTDGTIGFNEINFIFRMFFFLFFALNSQLKMYYLEKIDNRDEMILDSLMMMTLIGSINSPVMLRMCEFYAIGMYGSMGLLLSAFEDKSYMLAALIYGIIMIIILIRFLIVTDNGLYLNYHTWLF